MYPHQEQHYLAVINYLKHSLSAKTRTDDDSIPSAQELSQQLGFGEKPVQDVLECLATIGVLQSDGREFRLSEDMSATVAGLISLMLLSNHFSYQNLSHLRRAFELSALPHVIANMNDGIKSDLHSAVLHMKMAEMPNPKADSFFHRHMLAACGNPLVSCVADAISEAMELEITVVDQSSLELTWHEMVSIHERIFLALCSGDQQAAQDAINEHYDMADRQLAHIHV